MIEKRSSRCFQRSAGRAVFCGRFQPIKNQSSFFQPPGWHIDDKTALYSPAYRWLTDSKIHGWRLKALGKPSVSSDFPLRELPIFE
jgi:hypothetical protein